MRSVLALEILRNAQTALDSTCPDIELFARFKRSYWRKSVYVLGTLRVGGRLEEGGHQFMVDRISERMDGGRLRMAVWVIKTGNKRFDPVACGWRKA